MNPETTRALARIVKAVRQSEQGNTANRVLVLNLIGAVHDSIEEFEDLDVTVTESEAEKILSELPTTYDEEAEA